MIVTWNTDIHISLYCGLTDGPPVVDTSLCTVPAHSRLLHCSHDEGPSLGFPFPSPGLVLPSLNYSIIIYYIILIMFIHVDPCTMKYS